MNGSDKRGNGIKCTFCESIFQYTNNCLEKVYFNATEVETDPNVTLHQSNSLMREE